MEKYWNKLKHLFTDDDGSLPDIYIEPVTDQELIEIYNWVRSISKIPADATAWSTISQSGMLLSEFDDPSKSFIKGELELFRHALPDLEIDDINVPQLTIAISTHCVSFDYRKGPEWGENQLTGLFKILREIKIIAPDARIYQAWEGDYENPNLVFEQAFQNFIEKASIQRFDNGPLAP